LLIWFFGNDFYFYDKGLFAINQGYIVAVELNQKGQEKTRKDKKRQEKTKRDKKGQKRTERDRKGQRDDRNETLFICPFFSFDVSFDVVN
jgi:hypothetical protein